MKSYLRSMEGKPQAGSGYGLFVDVILPLSLPRLMTYKIPSDLEKAAEIGKRVIVQLGRHKIYSALIRRIHHDPPPLHDVKHIHSILDDHPIITEKHLEFWDWISSYYLSNLGDVMISALPAALKLHSATRIILNPGVQQEQIDLLTDTEYLLYDALLTRHEITINDAEKITQRKSVHALLKSMIDKGVLSAAEEIVHKYKPKKEVKISLQEEYYDDQRFKELFDTLGKRSPRQVDALLHYMKLHNEQRDLGYVFKSRLLKADSSLSSAITALVKKGVFTEEEIIMDRLSTNETGHREPMTLSHAQSRALDEIKKHFEEDPLKPVLLHGVTSSGKTELYVHLIDETLKKGRQVLYLLPEIALTAQMINRLRRYFGNKVMVYHSRLNSNERVEVWKSVSTHPEGKPGADVKIILGARSSLFLPYTNLGLVIIDEEHDSSYKQQEPAPRYNARDTALVLARQHGAYVLLGSATPSLESYYNVKEHKFALAELHERFGNMDLPEIIITDVAEAVRKKQMKSHFTPMLLSLVKEALENKEQVILFQNRRGFAPVIECRNCGWIPQCKNCSVTLTYHKHVGQLKCHYCGYSQMTPSICQQCGDYHLEIKGFGTEKIEEEISIFFPEARIARLDIDATRSRNAFQKVINDLEERNIDILVGTQMVTKGLDFENVSTIGILNADLMLNFPDFRAHERSYQLMAQVSGRSGRKLKRGKVIIQSHQPDHWVIRDVMNNDYPAFYERDLFERRKFSYPPLNRLIEILMKHKDEELIHAASFKFADALRVKLGNRVVGPHQPLIARIKNLWQRRILVKIEREASGNAVKEIIRNEMETFYGDMENRSVQIVIDVDPM